MRRFIIKTYRVLYNLIGIKPVAFTIALAYISFLNIVTLYGCCVLLRDVFPTEALFRLFEFPYVIGTGTVIMAINLVTTPPYYTIRVSEIKRENYALVVGYTLVAAALFAYTIYCRMDA